MALDMGHGAWVGVVMFKVDGGRWEARSLLMRQAMEMKINISNGKRNAMPWLTMCW